MVRLIRYCGLLLFAFGILWGQKQTITLVAADTVRDRILRGAVSNKERPNILKELFAEAGCLAEERLYEKKHGNVVCTLPGEGIGTIIVGGHFDYVVEGKGMVDDWSGTSMQISLFESLKEIPHRRHTFLFVGFDQEEKGLVGSTRFVKAMSPDEIQRVRAFVNLECLGLGTTNIWVHRSSPELVGSAVSVADALGIAVNGVDVDQVGDDDTHPFQKVKIPVISFHSIIQATLRVLHSAKDTDKNVNPEAYYQTYRFIAHYLAYLDATLAQ